MKRIIALLCMVAISILAFAACNNGGGNDQKDDCQHTFSEAWSSDKNQHWHAATCEHGEQKDSLADHIDADEDGVCEVCSYEVGHTHTFASDWTITEEKHWKASTCSHKDQKIEESLHKDEDLNGECDVCGGHVHILDGAGFCAGCDKEIKPVVEKDIGSVISATTARDQHVVSGTVDYYQISRLANENGEIKHLVEYMIGTNGTYSKRSYDEVETIGEFPNAVVNKTGNTEVLEKWIKIVNAEEVEGISAISVNGVYKNAEPSSYGVDDLAGYYYAVSTLADGHGAEEILFALYDAYLNYGIEDASVVHDADNNKYDFVFKALVVGESKVNNEIIYNANYYEVEISFTYSNNYILTSLDILCNCWTSDAGALPDGSPNYEEIDIQYDPDTETFEFVTYDFENKKFVPATETPRADTYEIHVTQTEGTREEIVLNDGSQFAPTDFGIFTDEECTKPLGDSFSVDITNVNTELYLKAYPAESFISFLKNDFEITVTDKNGNPSSGLVIVLVGEVIQVLPASGGEYVVSFSALDKTKTVDVTVTAPEIKGEKFFTVEVTETYSWSAEWGDEGVCYEFVATTYGQYTFYLPVNFGIIEKGNYEDRMAPDVDPFDYGYNPASEHSITVTLIPNQVYRFYFAAVAKGTYTIGYDAP